MNIALDIGHAHNTGSRGNGLEEHASVSVIAACLAPILREQGHNVTVIDFPNMSNPGDLTATIRAANAGNYDIGISLHCDCSDNPAAKGGHVCYISPGGKKLAKCIGEIFSDFLPGRVDSISRRDNLAILKQTVPVWVLCECGFISNPDDAKLIKDNPGSIAALIASGIQNYVRKEK